VPGLRYFDIFHPFMFFFNGSLRGSQLLNVPATKTSSAKGEWKEKIIFLIDTLLVFFMYALLS